MRCRVADSTQSVEDIHWFAADGSRLRPGRENQLPSGADDAQKLRLQLAETERRHQAELAQARQEGFAAGIEKVREEATAEVKAALDRVAATLAELVSQKQRVRNDAELELLKLSIAIARRIVYREIALDADALEGVIHTALQKLAGREITRARVFPAGLDALRTALARFGAPPSLELVADSNLRIGDVIFETGMGQLDASIEGQLAEIQRGLTDRLALR